MTNDPGEDDLPGTVVESTFAADADLFDSAELTSVDGSTGAGPKSSSDAFASASGGAGNEVFLISASF